MNMRTTRFLFLVFLLALPLLSGCFAILTLEQPDGANAGATISVYLEVRTAGRDDGPHYGIIAFLIPLDWTVNSVDYSGDFGPNTCTFLHPDSIDGDPGGQVDYWTDSLEVRYPSGDGMHWLVYQTVEPYNWPYDPPDDTAYVDVDVEFTVGTTGGTHNIGYFVTNAALDFSDSTWYAISLNNEFEVTGSAVEGDGGGSIPADYALRQNYPNPFNPKTTIVFDLPESGEVTLKLFNVLGEEMRTVTDGYYTAGSHRIAFDAAGLQSGIYYYKLEAEQFTATRKMLVLK